MGKGRFIMRYGMDYMSPLGLIHLRSDGEFLTGLWFDGSRDDFKHLEECVYSELPIFEDTIKWLNIYFSGKIPSFSIKYRVIGASDFRKSVLKKLENIPYGEVVTYGEIANMIAKERGISRMSSQAVGGAVGWNPICIIIPCHRVVGMNGNLTGYGGGILNKVELLKLEGNDMSKFYMPKEKRG